jgi:prepilin-type N-terminal cleavage/methylation domain-containing protein
MKNTLFKAGFTLLEILVAASVFTILSASLVLISSMMTRMVARNLTTNHGHHTLRVSGQKMLAHMHDAASAFRLVNFDGTNYTDAVVTATTDLDPFSQKFISSRANGVRFRIQSGGPYRLTQSTVASSRNLSFNFAGPDGDNYIPEVGDKVVLPLIAREFRIVAVPTKPTSSNRAGTITIEDTAGIGFPITVNGSSVTVANFYRMVAYTVHNRELRFHPNFTGAAQNTSRGVSRNITSTKPFALLYDTLSSASTDALNLRISLEAYDQAYSARRFANGTGTLQSIVPGRTQPTPVSSTN